MRRGSPGPTAAGRLWKKRGVEGLGWSASRRACQLSTAKRLAGGSVSLPALGSGHSHAAEGEHLDGRAAATGRARAPAAGLLEELGGDLAVVHPDAVAQGLEAERDGDDDEAARDEGCRAGQRGRRGKRGLRGRPAERRTTTRPSRTTTRCASSGRRRRCLRPASSRACSSAKARGGSTRWSAQSSDDTGARRGWLAHRREGRRRADRALGRCGHVVRRHRVVSVVHRGLIE